ncbi:hypothetical protein JW988_00855 [Candidatus Bathyarchaeota archaeon]|nr:hypothetical protein [Candidatus Bathyarchaeota archaeon]
MEKSNTKRRVVELTRTFNEVWESLCGKTADLKTSADTPFTVRAKMARKKGSFTAEKVLAFMKNVGSGKLKECSRCYSEDWGYYFNHLGVQGQRIGMYLKALDR